MDETTTTIETAKQERIEYTRRSMGIYVQINRVEAQRPGHDPVACYITKVGNAVFLHDAGDIDSIEDANPDLKLPRIVELSLTEGEGYLSFQAAMDAFERRAKGDA